MKKLAVLSILFITVCFVAACKSNTREINGERYAKKIYLTKEDYLEDLQQTAQRRELQPNKESEYIFNVVPQVTEDTNVYFFDKHQQPKVPGEYTAQDYKNEKRLWKKPKRYSPEQYYGMQESGGNDGGAGSEDNYYE
ncbi:MAG: hypothetical protein J6Q05_01775 [Elusimicrobiaceae bacterium]|nr:hypothetical protein [Elusimicrobiaceae bacterium]